MEKYCTVGQATDDSIIRRMHFACWILKATDTHSEYIIHIAFPRQQWLRERASILRYTYIACFIYPSVIHWPINRHYNQLTIMHVVLVFLKYYSVSVRRKTVGVHAMTGT
jgi:hypothetical protein